MLLIVEPKVEAKKGGKEKKNHVWKQSLLENGVS